MITFSSIHDPNFFKVKEVVELKHRHSGCRNLLMMMVKSQ
jgi:hypothetical protein